MKFGQVIKREREASPLEWGPFWLNYKLLKKKIKSMTSAVKDHLPSDTTPEALSNSKNEVEFFRLMDYEIRRGAQFLSLAEGQYVLKTRNVLDGYRTTQHLLQSPMLGLDSMLSAQAAAEMWICLLQACVSVYTELLLLNHWVVVRYCGFSKILKKHDRWTGFMTKEKYLRSVVVKQHFNSYRRLHSMLADMQTLYAHIVKHVPQCPERDAAHDKMLKVKEFVSSAAREFSKHTDGLTRVVQGGGGGSSSSALDHDCEGLFPRPERHESSSEDNPEPGGNPAPRTSRNGEKPKRNRGEMSETVNSSEGHTGAESSGNGGKRDRAGGPIAKRRKSSAGPTIKCTVSTVASAELAEHNRAEIGKLKVGAPWRDDGGGIDPDDAASRVVNQASGDGGRRRDGARKRSDRGNRTGVRNLERREQGGSEDEADRRGSERAAELLHQLARADRTANHSDGEEP